MKTITIRKILILMLSAAMLCFGSILCHAQSSAMNVVSMKTDDLDSPIGIDSTAPRLSWKLSDTQTRAQVQTSYRIRAAKSVADLESLSLVWDSGVVSSDETSDIAYAGMTLEPSTRYYWNVEVADKDGNTKISEAAYFETGLMNEGWSDAKWIAKTEAQRGFDYTSFSIEGDFTVVTDACSFLFGASNTSDYYMWQISAFTWHADGRIRPHKCVGGAFSELSSIDNVTATRAEIIGKPIHMKIEVNEGVIKTYVNSVLKDTRTVEPFRLGLVGFRESGTEAGAVDNLVIKDADGNTVFSNDFSDADNTGFAAGTVTDGKLSVTSSTVLTWMKDESAMRSGEGAPMFRREFTPDAAKTVKNARLYATACGIYEMYVNGSPVTDSYFNPGSTAYDDHIMYQSFDVTSLLKSGTNAVGGVLGHGWFNKANRYFGPTLYLKAKLRIEYTDGTVDNIVTDGSWQYYRYGPITQDDYFMGYTYDANREVNGWNEAGFDASDWESPLVAANNNLLSSNSPVGEIISQNIPLIKNTITLDAIAVTEPNPGVYLYDFGQNLAGIPEIKASAAKGSTMTVRYGEILNRDRMKGGDGEEGTLYTENLHEALNIDKYTFKGDGTEVFKPSLVYHGFRYLEITGLDAPLPLSDVKAMLLMTDLEQTSTFNSSNELVNRLYLNALWSARDNFLSVPTDCPQRNERWGWTGDAQVFARTASYFMDVNAFYNKYTMDMRDAAGTKNGYTVIPDVAPASKGSGWYDYAGSGNYATNGWGDAIVVIPWQIYQQYGNKSIIENNFDTMCDWVDYLVSSSDNYVRAHSWTGDWMPVNEKTPVGVTDTAYCAYSSLLLSKMAEVIGDSANSAKYLDIYNNYRTAWQENFLLEDGATTKCGTQTSYVMGLKFGLFDEDKTESAARHLVENISSRGWHLTTGFLGLNLLNPTLSDFGYTNVAYKLLEQTEYPSWLYSVTTGSTTIWESWYALRTYADGTSSVSSESFNHFSYGAVFEWAFTDVLGIERDEENPGFKHFILKPEFGGTFTNASGSYNSPKGMIESAWTMNNQTGAFTYNAQVPANTTATLYIPCENAETAVLEGGISADTAEGITYTGYSNGCKIYELGSGNYSFETTAGSGDISYVEVRNDLNVSCTVTSGSQTITEFPTKLLASGSATLDAVSNDANYKFLYFLDPDGNKIYSGDIVNGDTVLKAIFAYTGTDDSTEGDKNIIINGDVDELSVTIDGVSHALPYTFTNAKGTDTAISVTGTPYTKEVAGWSFSEFFGNDITISPLCDMTLTISTKNRVYYEGYDIFMGFDEDIYGWAGSGAAISYENMDGNGYMRFVSSQKTDGTYDPRISYDFTQSKSTITLGEYVPAADYGKIVVGFIADSIGADNTPFMYIATQAQPNYLSPVRGKGAVTKVTTGMADGKTLYEVTYDVSSWSAWTGNIKTIYLDVLDNVSGTIHIDYIRLAHRDFKLTVKGNSEPVLFAPGATADLSAITPPAGNGTFKGYSLTEDSQETVSTVEMNSDITVYPVYEIYKNPYVWNFEDGSMNNLSQNNFSSNSIVNGVLTLKTGTTADVQLNSATGLAADASEYKYVVIKMKHNVPDGSFGAKGMQVFFRRTTDTWYGEDRMLSVTPKSSEAGMCTYEIYMPDDESWNGTIDQLRIDPFELTGDYTIEIDSIELAKQSTLSVYDGYNEEAVSESARPYGTEIVLAELPVPERSGYHFAGWSLVKNGSVITDDTVKLDAETRSLYAVWRGSVKWDFETSTQGFAITNFGSNSVSGGVLSLTAGTTADMVLNSPEVAIDASENKYVVIKMKHDVPAGAFGSKQLEVFFRTSNDPWHGETRKVNLRQASASDDFVTYIAYMGGNPEWTGTIVQIRVDPFEITGNYSIDIDSIEVCSSVTDVCGTVSGVRNGKDLVLSSSFDNVVSNVSLDASSWSTSSDKVGMVGEGNKFVTAGSGITTISANTAIPGLCAVSNVTVVEISDSSKESYAVHYDGKDETLSGIYSTGLVPFMTPEGFISVNGYSMSGSKKDYTLHEVFAFDGKKINELSDALRLYDVASIRTSDPTGIRFMASVEDQQFGGKTVGEGSVTEYGFLVTTKKRFDAFGLTYENVGTGKAVKGAAFDAAENVHRTYLIDNERDAFTGVLINIPAVRENYITTLCVRAYYVVDQGGEKKVVYSDVKSTSLYDFAKSVLSSSSELDEKSRKQLEDIVAVVEDSKEISIDVGVLYD